MSDMQTKLIIMAILIWPGLRFTFKLRGYKVISFEYTGLVWIFAKAVYNFIVEI